MQDCWIQEPLMRPGFGRIREMLEMILSEMDNNPYADVSVSQMTDSMLDIVNGAPGEKC